MTQIKSTISSSGGGGDHETLTAIHRPAKEDLAEGNGRSGSRPRAAVRSGNLDKEYYNGLVAEMITVYYAVGGDCPIGWGDLLRRWRRWSDRLGMLLECMHLKRQERMSLFDVTLCGRRRGTQSQSPWNAGWTRQDTGSADIPHGRSDVGAVLPV
jgi:hypothetical protein